MPRKTERLYTDGDGLELRPATFRSDHAEEDCTAHAFCACACAFMFMFMSTKDGALAPHRSTPLRGCACHRRMQQPGRTANPAMSAHQQVRSRQAILDRRRPCSCRARSRRRSSPPIRSSQAARSARQQSATDPGTTAASLRRAVAAPREEVVLLHNSRCRHSLGP